MARTEKRTKEARQEKFILTSPRRFSTGEGLTKALLWENNIWFEPTLLQAIINPNKSEKAIGLGFGVNDIFDFQRVPW